MGIYQINVYDRKDWKNYVDKELARELKENLYFNKRFLWYSDLLTNVNYFIIHL